MEGGEEVLAEQEVLEELTSVMRLARCAPLGPTMVGGEHLGEEDKEKEEGEKEKEEEEEEEEKEKEGEKEKEEEENGKEGEWHLLYASLSRLLQLSYLPVSRHVALHSALLSTLYSLLWALCCFLCTLYSVLNIV